MVNIKLNLNQSINPCIVTYNGDYVPKNHPLYITCNHSEKELYNKYGWYLGSIYIGSDNLHEVRKEIFSDILSDIHSSIDLNLEGSINKLKKLIINLIEKVIKLINTKLAGHIQSVRIMNKYIRPVFLSN